MTYPVLGSNPPASTWMRWRGVANAPFLEGHFYPRRSRREESLGLVLHTAQATSHRGSDVRLATGTLLRPMSAPFQSFDPSCGPSDLPLERARPAHHMFRASTRKLRLVLCVKWYFAQFGIQLADARVGGSRVLRTANDEQPVPENDNN
eukprot:2314497-Amphidinium_carterae.5